MQAFLQRIVNSGGWIEREYGLGKMRTDLLVIWNVRGDRGRRREDESQRKKGGSTEECDRTQGTSQGL